MSMSMPGAPLDYPGLERFPPFTAYAGSGASPRTWNVQLPGYGTWLLILSAFYSNENVSIVRPYLINWFRLDAAGSQAKNLAAAWPLGSAVPAVDAASGTLNTWTDLSLAAPDTAGLMVATGTWSGGLSQNPRLIVTGHRLRGAVDFTR